MTLNAERRHHDSAIVKSVAERRDVHRPLHYAYFGVVLEKCYQGRERVAVDYGVVIEKKNIGPSRSPYADIVAAREAWIAGRRDVPHRFK